MPISIVYTAFYPLTSDEVVARVLPVPRLVIPESDEKTMARLARRSSLAPSTQRLRTYCVPVLPGHLIIGESGNGPGRLGPLAYSRLRWTPRAVASYEAKSSAPVLPSRPTSSATDNTTRWMNESFRMIAGVTLPRATPPEPATRLKMVGDRRNKMHSYAFSQRTAVGTWAGQKNTSPAAGRTERHLPSP